MIVKTDLDRFLRESESPERMGQKLDSFTGKRGFCHAIVITSLTLVRIGIRKALVTELVTQLMNHFISGERTCIAKD